MPQSRPSASSLLGRARHLGRDGRGLAAASAARGEPGVLLALEELRLREERDNPVVGRLLSVNIGLPKEVPWQGRTVFTGVFKDPVSGPRRVAKLNVDGDGQGDLAGHGGEQRAVFVYQRESYRG